MSQSRVKSQAMLIAERCIALTRQIYEAVYFQTYLAPSIYRR